MPGGAPAFMPCLPSCPAHSLFILQSYVFLGAKPNYPAFFALNVFYNHTTLTNKTNSYIQSNKK